MQPKALSAAPIVPEDSLLRPIHIVPKGLRSFDASDADFFLELRPGPHDVIQLCEGGRRSPMRSRDGQRNAERAFFDLGNFVTAADGTEIPGNRGEPWPWRDEELWT